MNRQMLERPLGAAAKHAVQAQEASKAAAEKKAADQQQAAELTAKRKAECDAAENEARETRLTQLRQE